MTNNNNRRQWSGYLDKSPVLVKAVRVRMMPLNKPKKWRSSNTLQLGISLWIT